MRFDAYEKERDLLHLIYLNIGLSSLANINWSGIEDGSTSEFAALLQSHMDAGIVRRYDNFDTLMDFLFNLFDMAALQCYVLNRGAVTGNPIDIEAHKKTLSQFVQAALLVDNPPPN